MKCLSILFTAILLLTLSSNTFARRVPECGVESYNSRRDPICGVELYFETRSTYCAPELFNMGTSSACGVTIERKREIIPCESDRPKFDCYRTYERQIPNTCRHPSFGVEVYSSCRAPQHGVEQYLSCTNVSFGVASYKDCAIFMTISEINTFIEYLDLSAPETVNRLDLSLVNMLQQANSAQALACYIAKKEESDPMTANELKENFFLYTNGMNYEDVNISDCQGQIQNAIIKDCSSENNSTTSYCRYKKIYDNTKQQIINDINRINTILNDPYAKIDQASITKLNHFQNILNESTNI